MPLFLTLLISKFFLLLNRLTGSGGSALPGLVAEKLDPQILSKLGTDLSEGCIVVTGTNGKTTTTKMLLAILESAGHKVMTNQSGSNLSRGVVSAFIDRVDLSGSSDYDMGLFEVDEASMPAVCDQLRPKKVIVLNLFRDQLDRYGELDKTAGLIGRSIEALSGADVYLNADDPLVASLNRYAGSNNLHYYGAEGIKVAKLKNDMASDSDHCPLCGRALKYSQAFFSHLGHYKCPNKHFERPKTQVVLSSFKAVEPIGGALVVKAGSSRAALTLQLPGLYNAYNALAALAAVNGQIPLKQAANALQSVSAAFGRVERVVLDGREVYLLLVKNPTGFNQIIQTFIAGQSGRHLMIAINDNFADGRDVSWLWDVAFEELQGGKHHIVTSGIRATDMALRLKYAEVGAEIQPDLAKAIKQLVAKTPKSQPAYVLPTYTAMLQLRRSIGKQANLEGFWK